MSLYKVLSNLTPILPLPLHVLGWELRGGEDGLGPDLARDDAGAAQCVKVLLRTDNDAEDDLGMVAGDNNKSEE